MAEEVKTENSNRLEKEYILYYKVHLVEPGGLSTLDTMDILRSNLTFVKEQKLKQFYDCIADSIDIDTINDYKYIEFAITDGTTKFIHKIFEMYPHQYKYNMMFIDNVEGKELKMLVCPRTYFAKEHANFNYVLDRVTFNSVPSEIQHIDFVLTDGDESIKNDPNHDYSAVTTYGNVILHEDNIAVDKEGHFINEDSGEYIKFNLNDKFEEDKKYYLYIYHHESNEVFIKKDYTPISMWCGENPILNKVFFADGSVIIDTENSILDAAMPDSGLFKWYFDLSISTHGNGVEGGIIYADSNGKEIADDKVKNFYFETATSSDNDNESYTGIYITNNNPFIILPNRYFNEKYDNYGSTSAVLTNDLFGSKNYNGIAYDENHQPLTNEAGEYVDKWGTIITESEYTYRTLFGKFYIPKAGDFGLTQIIEFYNNKNNKQINISIDTQNNSILIHDASTDAKYEYPLNNKIEFNKWYNILIIVHKGTIKYINITDENNASQTTMEVNTGLTTYNTNRIATDKVTKLSFTYTLTGGVEGEIGIIPIITSYQYMDSEEPFEYKKSYSDSVIVLKPGELNTIDIEFNQGGYGVCVGYKVVNLLGGFTKDASLTIHNIAINDENITFTNFEQYIEDTNTGFTSFYTPQDSIIITKNASQLKNPIGGDWITVDKNFSELCIEDEYFITNWNQNYNNDLCGIKLGNYSEVYISKLGLTIQDVGHEISISNPYEFIPSSIMKVLAKGYEYNPSLIIDYGSQKVTVPASYYKETKDRRLWTAIPADIPTGSCHLKIYNKDICNYDKVWEARRVKPNDDTIDFEIDFSKDFDGAIDKFKDIFYLKQSKRAGDLSGGENANMIHFTRGEGGGAAVFENHGDYYQGNICCNQKEDGIHQYGGVAPQLPYQIDTDGKVKFYNKKYSPDPTKPRTQRVGSLVQSKRYYGYGEFELDMMIPRGFKGEAICWWMFHYQELYWPQDADRLAFYIGGRSKEGGDDNPVVTYPVRRNGPDVAGFNYLRMASNKFGSQYVIVNNEIDLELGSEINQINSDKNPNNNTSLVFYTPLLDPRTVVGCSSPGSDYGLWMLDWEKSKIIINKKLKAIEDTVSSTGKLIDRTKNPNLTTAANELIWVHVSTKIYDNICYDANTRAIRWNNWLTEPDVGGLVLNTQYSNADKLFRGLSWEKQGSGYDMMNSVAATTPRTPLGKINLNATRIDDRFTPHEMDDGEWHTWKFVWDRNGTSVYLDGEHIRDNNTCSPFIPMPFIIGGWFPSPDSYSDGYPTEGYFGSWAGVKAPWDVYNFYVRRIKYKHYTEEESPRDQMIYHAESFPEAGLREIISKPNNEIITIPISIPTSSYLYINGLEVITTNSKTNYNFIIGKVYNIVCKSEGYKTYDKDIMIDENTTNLSIVLEKHKYTVTISCNVPDAYITINGSHNNIIELINANDSFEYSVSAPGYITETNNLHLTKEEFKNYKCELFVVLQEGENPNPDTPDPSVPEIDDSEEDNPIDNTYGNISYNVTNFFNNLHLLIIKGKEDLTGKYYDEIKNIIITELSPNSTGIYTNVDIDGNGSNKTVNLQAGITYTAYYYNINQGRIIEDFGQFRFTKDNLNIVKTVTANV